MKRIILVAALVSVLVAGAAGAHELIRKASRESAVIIELSYPDHTPYSYEQFEIYRDGENVPYQTGRSDALGRIVFLPDRDGTWRIRAFSEDGHGIDFTVQAGPGDHPGTPTSSGGHRSVRIVLGLIIIVAVFMAFLLVVRRRGW